MTNLKPRNPNFISNVQDKMKNNNFMHFIGFEPTIIEAGKVEGKLTITSHHKQQIGFLHGGVIATLADLVSGWAAFTLVEEGKSVVTVELKTNFLNPGTGDKAWAKGYVIKAGNFLTFTECEIYCNNNNQDTLIAKAYGTFATIQHS